MSVVGTIMVFPFQNTHIGGSGGRNRAVVDAERVTRTPTLGRLRSLGQQCKRNCRCSPAIAPAGIAWKPAFATASGTRKEAGFRRVAAATLAAAPRHASPDAGDIHTSRNLASRSFHSLGLHRGIPLLAGLNGLDRLGDGSRCALGGRAGFVDGFPGLSFFVVRWRQHVVKHGL